MIFYLGDLGNVCWSNDCNCLGGTVYEGASEEAVRRLRSEDIRFCGSAYSELYFCISGQWDTRSNIDGLEFSTCYTHSYGGGYEAFTDPLAKKE